MRSLIRLAAVACILSLPASPCPAQALAAAVPHLVPHIEGSALLRESLWVSSREVLRLCQPDLKHFALVDAVSGQETPLPALTALP